MNYPGRIIKKGERNKKLVKAIQEKLNELNCGPLIVDGIFGLKTHYAVKLFQSLHRDQHGSPLVIDGLLGPVSWYVLFGSASVPVRTIAPNTFLKEAVNVARSQVGVLERPLGSNSGPEVDQYLASIGLGPGYFWCMAFVYWCFEEAANNLGRTNPLVRTGGVMYQWSRTSQKKIQSEDAINDPSRIQPGYIFIISHGGGKGHTGIVTAVEGGKIATIEGNSNTTGSRNGIGVVELSRKILSINRGFIACR